MFFWLAKFLTMISARINRHLVFAPSDLNKGPRCFRKLKRKNLSNDPNNPSAAAAHDGCDAD